MAIQTTVWSCCLNPLIFGAKNPSRCWKSPCHHMPRFQSFRGFGHACLVYWFCKSLTHSAPVLPFRALWSARISEGRLDVTPHSHQPCEIKEQGQVDWWLDHPVIHHRCSDVQAGHQGNGASRHASADGAISIFRHGQSGSISHETVQGQRMPCMEVPEC